MSQSENGKVKQVGDPGEEEVFVVSDLHLGPGQPSCVESFFNDKALGSFIDHVGDGTQSSGSCRLVILGDFLDFLRAQLVTNPEDHPCTEAIALETLEVITAGHPEVFDALGRLLARGARLDIVVGNHDTELIRPRLQQRLRSILAAAGAGDAADGVRFFPWIYHVPGVLYAEHGQQYDDVNVFSTLLEPFDPQNPDVLERSIGTYLFMASERLMGRLDPCPDHASPPLRYFKLAARRQPGAAKWIVGEEVDILRGAVRHARHLSGAGRAARRATYREKMLDGYDAEVGLDPDTVLWLDSHSSASKTPMQALRRQALLRTVKKVVPSRPLPTGRSSSYLHKAAHRIHGRFADAGSAVPFYIFGHSHAAQHLPLDFGPGAPQYLNTGTWSSIVSPASDTIRTLRPTFVCISTKTGARPVGRLMAWNGASASGETLRFQT